MRPWFTILLFTSAAILVSIYGDGIAWMSVPFLFFLVYLQFKLSQYCLKKKLEYFAKLHAQEQYQVVIQLLEDNQVCNFDETRELLYEYGVSQL